MKAGELRYLNQFHESSNGTCKGVWACAILYSLGFDDETVEAHWRKVREWDVGYARTFISVAESQRPERRLLTLIEFHKRFLGAS